MIIGIAARLMREHDEREGERKNENEDAPRVPVPVKLGGCARAKASSRADRIQIDLFRREIAQHTDK
jgi:hypothetical protein